ncbi:MAG: PilZ domain-containing protein [Bradyrhizobium sp.]
MLSHGFFDVFVLPLHRSSSVCISAVPITPRLVVFGNVDFRTGNARMVETRIAPRHRVMKPAKIEYGGMKTPCTIRDLSVTGAALEISELNGKVPATFNLILPEEKLKLPCHVVWRREFRIGVAFD